MTSQIPIVRGSVIYVTAAIAEAAGGDLSGDVVELAVHRGDPETAQWLPAAWATPGVARTASPVTFTTAAYPGPTYDVYARLTDTPEVPIIYAGSIALID